jgi:hypothetical protein
VLAVYSLAFLVIGALFILDRLLEGNLLSQLRATIILLRHIPPPHIAQTPDVLSLILPQPPADDIQDISQTAFERCSVPAVCLSQALIVEAVNDAFVSTFSIVPGFIVGQPVTALIPKPAADNGKLPPEERGAFHLHNKLEKMVHKDANGECSYTTKCLSGESYVPAHVTAYSVKGAGFVLIIEDRQPIDVVRQKLEEQKRAVEHLQEQLMPVDLRLVNIEGEKAGTLLVVQIHGTLGMSKDKLADLFSVVTVLAKSHPPFIVFNILFDTVYAVGGIFLDSADPQSHARPAIGLAKTISEELQQSQVQFAIGITFAQDFIVTVIGDNCQILDVASRAIDEAADMVLAAPVDAIVVSARFAEVMGDAHASQLNPGPTVGGKQSFLL